ncbi:MAG: hypothetical protein QG602_3160 [Verrucomicrobiota bacterium]|nr:hypothetical protein [Verrucomicrobiota bacterium]
MPALLSAQETSAAEEDRMSQLSRSDGMWYTPKTRVSVGLRILDSGGKVNFGNLGTVPFVHEIIPATDGAVVRNYSDGQVGLDSLRTDEVDGNGNQTSTPGGRYQVFSTSTVNVTDADGNVIGTQDVQRLVGDYLSYTPGMTREWDVMGQSQFLTKPGYVAFNNYAAISDGASLTKEQGMNGGLELQVSRELGSGGRYFKWGVLAGISLNDINSKTAGSVASTLRTYTDYYTTNGATLPLSQLGNPSYDTTLDTNGDGVANTYENTVALPIAYDPGLSTDVLTPGGANVTGRWQVKGAYFMLKFGPTLRTQISEHFAISASVGLAGAYAGTRYTAYESFQVAAMPNTDIETVDEETGSSTLSSTATKLLTGYYADLNLDWDMNDRFGLFGGVTAQQLDSYEQKLGGRTADIDLGSAVGVRGGVTVRF